MNDILFYIYLQGVVGDIREYYFILVIGIMWITVFLALGGAFKRRQVYISGIITLIIFVFGTMLPKDDFFNRLIEAKKTEIKYHIKK